MNINYYNKNATDFYESTINVDMSELYKPFVKYLCSGSVVLDAGCGSGRDIKYFLSKGYLVEAFDSSINMRYLAKELTGISIKNISFQQFAEKEKYHGVWSCASLLHVPMEELLNSMQRITNSLKPDGVWYLSFKYGASERTEKGRKFTDLNEELLASYVRDIKNLSLLKTWLTEDARSDRKDVWLNAILTKK